VKVGFVGIGTMGRHMAANLQAGGYDLVVHDLRREAAADHLAAGASWAATPAEVADASDVVFTSLPGPVEVEAVAAGPDGLLQGARTGAAWFDLSTNSPTVVRRLHAQAATRGLELLDAPVSGGPRGAESGKLAVWVGGDRPTFDAHLPVLRAFADEPYHVGPVGAGSSAKLVHNCAGYVLQTALAEVFTLGVKAGVDPVELWKAVRHGAIGRRRTFDGLADQFLVNRFDPPSFALRLAHKDVSLATQLGRELGVPMRLANLTLEEMTEALGRGWGQRDSRSAMLLQEERAGVAIEATREALRAVFEVDPR
jgi:3-hydroxyisobutyrate dehydrogenase-like beta-hydroxyacid dehydrogenase